MVIFINWKRWNVGWKEIDPPDDYPTLILFLVWWWVHSPNGEGE